MMGWMDSSYVDERARERGFLRAPPGSEPYTSAAETGMLGRDYFDSRASWAGVQVAEADASKLVKYVGIVLSDILEMRNAELIGEIKQLGAKIGQMGTERDQSTPHGAEKHAW